MADLLNESGPITGHNYTKLFSQAPAPIAIYKGRVLRYVFANEAYLKIFNNRDIIGKTVREAFPELEGQPYFEILENVFDTGEPFFGNEVPALIDAANDGILTTRYYNLVYTPYRNDDGIIDGVMAFGHDVTEGVEARKKERESDIRFRNIVQQSTDPILILKGEDMVLDVANEALLRLWSIGPESFGKGFLEILPEMKDQGFYDLLLDVFHQGKTHYGYETPAYFKRANGEVDTRYFTFIYQPYREADGNITGVLVLATDVTEQVAARRKIEYVEENARMAIEASDLGTYEINLVTNEMFTSPRFDVIWGLDHKTIDRSEFAAVIHPDDQEQRAQAHKESLKTGHLHYEARIMRKDGTYRWVRVKGKILYNKEGTPQRLLGVIQDITEQKVFAEELSKKVEERTKELHELNRRLERSNEELEQFAYIASHDLQEPLRKIQLFNALVLEQPGLNEVSIKYLEKASASASRMTGLIRDLLDYSRLSQKNMRFEETDLNAILKNVLTDYELLITQKGAIINADELPSIIAIPLQMNQLLFNLVGNALKFTKRNVTPVISISKNPVSEEKKNHFQLERERNYVEIKITDNGIGFNEQYAQKIFTIFQRLNEKSLYGGYGIGLALCRKIVDNHAGIIYAEGKPKEGATFGFILPCNQI